VVLAETGQAEAERCQLELSPPVSEPLALRAGWRYVHVNGRRFTLDATTLPETAHAIERDRYGLALEYRLADIPIRFRWIAARHLYDGLSGKRAGPL
jgi:hypothetical protein